ncbi:MAG: hypothetical protein HY868_22265 [Chloroflexi bacterium]|nr:hypothetical protein [Chloroflexota bacterium]
MKALKKYIGNYLLDDGVVVLEDLDRALQKQIAWAAQGRSVKIGDVLIEMQLITRAQLENALARQARDAMEKS